MGGGFYKILPDLGPLINISINLTAVGLTQKIVDPPTKIKMADMKTKSETNLFQNLRMVEAYSF